MAENLSNAGLRATKKKNRTCNGAHIIRLRAKSSCFMAPGNSILRHSIDYYLLLVFTYVSLLLLLLLLLFPR